MDDRGIDRAAVRRGDAQLARGGRRQVVDDHVGARGQPQEHLLALVGREVEADALLRMAVGDQRAARPAAHQRPRRVPRGRLDLDHLGAEVGEDMRRERRGDHGAELDHAAPGEGFGTAHSALDKDNALYIKSGLVGFFVVMASKRRIHESEQR